MKKFFLLLVVILIYCQTSFAGDLYKKYYDKKNGYKGESCCMYVGCKGDGTPFSDIYEQRDFCIRTQSAYADIFEVKKLTKEDIFLIWSALEEFNYVEDEIYHIAIKKQNYSGYQWVYWIWVQITDNGNSFIWTGLNMGWKDK